MTKRRTLDTVLAGLGALLIALTVVVALTSGGSEEAAPPQAAASVEGDTVTIKGFRFMPPDLTVKAGTSVTFVNADTAGHTASASGVFDTDSIDKGQKATVTLDKPGTYMYICEFHPTMKAKVTVK